ncbi:MAG: LysR family transcriptional regulator [Kordiimonadaceae bacterium]|nr:LysR family transcriptional regulator [Kordiimonadaceae bacterium]
MTHALPPLNWLRSFEAAARHSSFSAAAKELNMTPSAISYQVKNLENYFGAVLFDRKARGVALTEIGRAYLPSVLKAFSDLSASSAHMFNSAGKSSLSIRVAISFGTLWLAPRIPDFLQKHPHIHVDLHSSLWISSEGQQDCDLEIRYGDGNWQGVQSEILIHETIELVASPTLQFQPKSAMDLLDCPLVHIQGVEDNWSRLFNRGNLSLPNSSRQIKADTSLMALEMVKAGAGCALLFKSFTQSLIREKKLIIPFNINLPTEQANHLLFLKGKTHQRHEVKLFAEWLLDQVTR